jgi:hypothetical protein
MAGTSPAMTKKGKVTMMPETKTAGRAKEAEALRWASNFLCEWRVCANASCRRARSCRGRPYLCGKRNSGALPKGVRYFFEAVLAAKLVGLPFQDFREDMEGREETQAFFAWRKAAAARPR